MGNIKKILLITAFCTSIESFSKESFISVFFEKYPEIKEKTDEEVTRKYSRKLQQPGYLYKKIVKSVRIPSGVGGIMGMYLGYVDVSNRDGQLKFHRGQRSYDIKLLVTKSVKPVFIVAPETVHNWMIDKSAPSKMYQYEFKQDKKTKYFYYEASEINLPKDDMIELGTIILIANPKNIFIPEGATIVNYSRNIILPPIFIKNNFNFSYNGLYTISIKQYFEHIKSEYKLEEQTISHILK